MIILDHAYLLIIQHISYLRSVLILCPKKIDYHSNSALRNLSPGLVVKKNQSPVSDVIEVSQPSS